MTAFPADQNLDLQNGPETRSRKPTAGDDTRARILDAALDTLRSEGISGVSARSVARKGNFNQALIFYHFGSVEGLLAAAAEAEGARRAELYAERFTAVSTIDELIAVAREVHQMERAAGTVTMLGQLLAGAANAPELRNALRGGMVPWLDHVERSLQRVIGASPAAASLPTQHLAYAVASLFIGLELMVGLDDHDERPSSLFDTFERLAQPFSVLLALFTLTEVPSASPLP